jgi:hypothetical protein
LALAPGLRDPEIRGSILSSLTVTDPDAELPRRSVAVEVRAIPAVSTVTESLEGVGPLAIPDPASMAAQVMPTFVRFHPLAFGSGVSVPLTIGPELSSTYEACLEPGWPVQLFALKSGRAVAVIVRTPSPEPAENANVHDDFAAADRCSAVWAPAICTHLVSLEVVRFKMSDPPFRAYSVSATTTVPVPPANPAAETDAAKAGGDCRIAAVTSAAAVSVRTLRARCRPTFRDPISLNNSSYGEPPNRRSASPMRPVAAMTQDALHAPDSGTAEGRNVAQGVRARQPGPKVRGSKGKGRRELHHRH